MFIIGLTGGIASGKSTVAEMLAARGAHLIDADRLAREAVEPGKPAWQEIIRWLGEDILLPDRTIDRRRLGELVFNDQAMRDRLNSIVHPRVEELFTRELEQIRWGDPAAVVVYDVPLLIETGRLDLYDLILLVYVSPAIQLERLCRRNNLEQEAAEKRLQAQIPLDEKKKHAHVIIDDSGSITETERQVETFWRDLTSGEYGKL
ncbi:MAG: dephospho-CoA kinase [Bacillota bacterium]